MRLLDAAYRGLGDACFLVSPTWVSSAALRSAASPSAYCRSESAIPIVVPEATWALPFDPHKAGLKLDQPRGA